MIKSRYFIIGHLPKIRSTYFINVYFQMIKFVYLNNGHVIEAICFVNNVHLLAHDKR